MNIVFHISEDGSEIQLLNVAFFLSPLPLMKGHANLVFQLTIPI